MMETMELVKPRFRFTDEFDLHLTREVYGQNPYEDPKRWAIIQVNMVQISGRPVSITTLKERVQNLIKKYTKKYKINEGLSGREETVTELDDLIQHIIELIKEFQNKLKAKLNQTTKMASYQKGFNRRENYVVSMQDSNDEALISNENIEENVSTQGDLAMYEAVVIETSEDVPTCENEVVGHLSPIKMKEKRNGTPKRKYFAQANILTPSGAPVKRKRTLGNLKHQTIEYLTKKNDQQHEIRCRELVLRERQLELEKEKFELEVEERRKRLEMEERKLAMEEKKSNVQTKLFENQQRLIEIVFQKNV